MIKIYLKNYFKLGSLLMIASLLGQAIIVFMLNLLHNDIALEIYAIFASVAGIFILLVWGIRSWRPAIRLNSKTICLRNFFGKTKRIKINEIHHVYTKASDLIIQYEKRGNVYTYYYDFTKTELKNTDSFIAAIQLLRSNQDIASINFNNTGVYESKVFHTSLAHAFNISLIPFCFIGFGIILIFVSWMYKEDGLYTFGRSLLNPGVWFFPWSIHMHIKNPAVQFNESGIQSSNFRIEVPYKYIQNFYIKGSKLILCSRCNIEGINMKKLNKDFKINLSAFTYEDAKNIEYQIKQRMAKNQE